MGRVDEALRRAAEGKVNSEAPVKDAEAIARETFPATENADEAAQAVAPTPVAPAAVPAAQTAAPTAVPGTGTGSASLLERMSAGLSEKMVIDQNMAPVSREQYRRLAATLHHAQANSGLKVILVASAVAGEGKTLTACNLALTFSESYQRSTLLIDCDLRRPSVHTVFPVPGSPGLTEGLSSIQERKMPLHQVTPRLTVLPAGRPSGDPMAGLTSERMRRVIAEARESFDWVIVDTPPIGLLTDANLLASWVDCCIIVIKADSTPYPLVVRAVEALGRERVIGAVLNRATVPAQQGSGYEYYGKYYSTTPAE